MSRLFPPQEVLPLHRREREEIDYKDLSTLKGYVTETGKHHPEPHHRHQGALSAPADARHQARALPGADAVHRRASRLSDARTYRI